MSEKACPVAAIDLFCGVGGLSLGLQQAGIDVIAGVDVDPACRFAYEKNLGAKFLLKSVADLQLAELDALWPEGSLRMLAGCAPCQPFSSHRRGADTSDEANWDLLSHFGRLVEGTRPDFVTMENVTRLARMPVFQDFVAQLRALGYNISFGSLYGPDFGLPQERRRLVLIASLLGTIEMPVPTTLPSEYRTVRQTIGRLPKLSHGDADARDPLHRARRLSPLNELRMKASTPGGTWRDWPVELRAACHQRATGASFQAFYGRMRWDAPSPTITTQSYNFGTGRFGHPEQDRSLTLREAAMLQGFPRSYAFVPDDARPSMNAVGRMIGNAVPPAFGRAVGRAVVEASVMHTSDVGGDAASH